MTAKTIEWPVTFSHQHNHRRMHDNLIELLQDFSDALKNEEDIPKLSDGSIDITKILVSDLVQWNMQEAKKLTHTHKENDENSTGSR